MIDVSSESSDDNGNEDTLTKEQQRFQREYPLWANQQIFTNSMVLQSFQDVVRNLWYDDLNATSQKNNSFEYYNHGYVSTTYINFILSDVLNFSMDQSVCIVDGFGSTFIANTNKIKAERINILEKIRNQIRESSNNSISPEMFPIRESTVKFPYKALVFIVPPTPRVQHFSTLVYYINLNSDKPRLYHYDSIARQSTGYEANKIMAKLISDRISKDGKLFNSTGEYEFIHSNNISDDLMDQRGNFGHQLQPSCATWSVAFCEKIHENIMRLDLSTLDSETVDKMNEICVTDITRDAVKKIELTCKWLTKLYYPNNSNLNDLQVDNLIDIRKQYIRNSITKILTFGNNDESRLNKFVDQAYNIYSPSITLSNPNKTKQLKVTNKHNFIYQDINENILPDFIRVFLLLNLVVPDDIVFSTELPNLFATYNSKTKSFKEQHQNPEDRCFTDRYHRNRKYPRLIVWLYLPENQNANEYPVIIVSRPLYPSILNPTPYISLNTLYVYSCAEEEYVKAKVIEFMTKMSPVKPLNPNNISIDGVLIFLFDKNFGRYSILQLLKSIINCEGELIDTPKKLNQYLSSVTHRTPDTQIPEFVKQIRYGKGVRESKMKTHDRQIRMEMYGMMLHLLAGNKVLPNTNTNGKCNIDKIFGISEKEFVIRDQLVSNALGIIPHSSWQGRTRRLWTSSYFNQTFHSCLIMAIYQATKCKDNDFVDKINGNSDQITSPETVAQRLIQSCPCAKITTNNESNIFHLFYHWNIVETQCLQIVKELVTSDIIAEPPKSYNAYNSINLIQVINLVKSHLCQFPVLVHASTIDYNSNMHLIVLDIWDIALICMQPDFFDGELRTKKIKAHDKQSIIIQYHNEYKFDTSSRIIQHDPYLHFVIMNFKPDQQTLMNERLETVRTQLNDNEINRNINELLTDKNERSLILYQSYADICIFAIQYLLQQSQSQ